jgi:hypothetical protein
MDPRSLGARDLLLAVFRLAVCDLRGIAYGHDEPLPAKRVRPSRTGEAATFLQSPWATALADRVDLSIVEVRRRAFGTDAELWASRSHKPTSGSRCGGTPAPTTTVAIP